jgi:hypothetical protein
MTVIDSTSSRARFHYAWIVALVVYGWIAASHQLGASLAAFGAGAIRTGLGDYSVAFWIAGGLCALAGVSFLTIGRRTFVRPVVVPIPALAANAAG